MRIRWANLLLLLISAAFGLILLEAGIRIFDLAPESEDIATEGLVFSTNPRLRYTMRPNGRWTHHRTVIDINRDGYRGRVSRPGPPEKETVRIICLGDSITLGLYMEDEETYSYQLETILNQARLFNKNWEVINFGVNGYNTINEVELLKVRGLKYQPDLVILQYCYNDHGNQSELDLRFKHAMIRNHRLVACLLNPVSRFFSKSKLFLFCFSRLNAGEPERPRRRHWWIPEQYVYQSDPVEQGLTEFKQLSQNCGFRPLVLIFPRFEKKYRRFSDYRLNYDRAIKLCEKNGLPYINLLDCFREEHAAADTYPDFHLDSCHPTAYANQIVADILFRRLEQSGPGRAKKR